MVRTEKLFLSVKEYSWFSELIFILFDFMKRSKVLGFLIVFLFGSSAIAWLAFKNPTSPEKTTLSHAGLIPDTLLNKEGTEISTDSLQGKYVGLYFSASWCGPCRSFTPELIRFRNEHAEQFEVVLVGGDGTAKDQAKYVKKYDMPWLSMINQSDEARQANESLGVKYIPFLVILDPSGNVVSKEGVKEIRALKNEAMNLWANELKGV
jgi:thiol-disulfide isomerase/thioredoxin